MKTRDGVTEVVEVGDGDVETRSEGVAQVVEVGGYVICANSRTE